METRETLAEQIEIQAAELQNDADAFDEAAARVLGLNTNDLHCLALIALRGAMTAGELAEAAALTPGAITTLVDRLEHAGYAHRRRDDVDRRRVLIEPTARALSIAGQIWGPLAAEGAASLLHFNEAELNAILEFLRLAREVHARHIARVQSLTLAGLERQD
ncbi:MarR family transcriptional regulator [bacterium]|nr:MarR family transcriptional regulator [bacterium]